MISKNIVVTKMVKFRSLLLILKEITSVFAIILNLFIWYFYSLSHYNITFTIGRYASKIHMQICFEKNDTKVGFYNDESCHKINILNLFYQALVATVYEWRIQISSCSWAVLWPEHKISHCWNSSKNRRKRQNKYVNAQTHMAAHFPGFVHFI